MANKTDEFRQLLLTELRDLRQDVKEVRQTDLPGIHTRIALLEENMRGVKKEGEKRAKVYAGVGGAVAILLELVLAHFRK